MFGAKKIYETRETRQKQSIIDAVWIICLNILWKVSPFRTECSLCNDMYLKSAIWQNCAPLLIFEMFYFETLQGQKNDTVNLTISLVNIPYSHTLLKLLAECFFILTLSGTIGRANHTPSYKKCHNYWKANGIELTFHEFS